MRLTKKFRNIYVYNFDKNCDFEERKERSIETHNKIIDKFGQLEDIEEEFGIDLITLFKALKNGFYSKSKDGIKFWKEDDNHIVFIRHLGYDIEICCEECKNERNAIPTMFLERSTKDYGKTWALTKEELL